MEQYIEKLVDNIKVDYIAYSRRGRRPDDDAVRVGIREKMITEFCNSVKIQYGSKYAKIIVNRSVWGFVVLGDDDRKFNKGDILKAAGRAGPARNFARGNVIAGGYRSTWTGA